MKKEEALLEYAQIKRKIKQIIENNPRYEETIFGTESQKLINHVDKMIGDLNVKKLDILEDLE